MLSAQGPAGGKWAPQGQGWEHTACRAECVEGPHSGAGAQQRPRPTGRDPSLPLLSAHSEFQAALPEVTDA